MHIKGITLNGFKSFPDKVTVWFDREITAVVGPNGSGKSNIVDAIRWVLGEQSAKTLRGGKMEDLIFSGTLKRGPKKSAEVTLILDNSMGELPLAEDEVRITRRVNQTHGSNYLLNGEGCRLKDIENLLMDGGMRKDSSSILGQGKIETILMSKPSDRRELFEEAAGIIKYKYRKKEAFGKLEHTQQQQRRIRDIIHELNRQGQPLKKQARTARKYMEIQGRLFLLEVNLLLKRYNNYSARLDALQTEVKACEKQFQEKEAEYQKFEKDLQGANSRRKEISQELDKTRQEIYQLGNKAEVLSNKIEINEEKIRVNRESKKEKLNNLETLAQSYARKKQEGQEIEAELEAKKEKVKALGEKLETFSQEEQKKITRGDELQQKREVLRGAIKDIFNDLSNKRQKVQELEGEKTRLETRIQELETTRETVKQNIAELKNNLAQSKANLDEKKRELEKHREKDKKNNGKLNKTRTELQDMSREKEELQKDLESVRNQLVVISDFREKGRGYHGGVRAVLEAAQSKKLEGILGIVSESFEVDGRYSEAIAAAIEGREQNIITETDRAARKAVQVLKENNSGRATFLPLDLINERSLSSSEEKILKGPGILGTGLELITFSPELKPVFSYLLGRVIVSEKMDHAVKASRGTGNRLRFVTLDGDIIQPGGAITGGSRRRRTLFSGSSQEADLNKTLKKLQKNIDSLATKLKEKETEQDNLRKKQEEFRGKIYELQLEEKALEKDIDLQEKNLVKMTAGLEEQEKRFSQLTKDLKKVKQSIEDEQGAIKTWQEKVQEKRNKLNELERELEELDLRRGEHQNSVMDLRVEMAENRQHYTHLQERLEKNREEVEEINVEQQEKEEQKQALEKAISQLKDNIADWKEQKISFREGKIKKEAQLQELENQKIELEEKESKLGNELEKLEEILEKTEKKLHSLQLEETRLEGEREKITDWLDREYNLSIENAKKHADEKLDLNGADSEIKELKQKKEKMGPVNLGAIDEFEALEKRLNFMREQHRDLREAQDTLNRIIEGIDRTMEKKFLSTFKRVSREFEDVFNKLFQGGKARLYLSNEEELLETGVEVVAQPPGKKLQKLSLMSGGEKALTAIALLFALMKVKPCPFYVLDEIDAPLDDANVDRFISFLGDINELSQFIIITHRKRTISEANTIYGITMEEEGISKIISYRLKERAS